LSLSLLLFIGGRFGFVVGRGGENELIEMTRITSIECLLLVLLEWVADFLASSCPSANTISSAMVVVVGAGVFLVALPSDGDDKEGTIVTGLEDAVLLLDPPPPPPLSRSIRLARDDEVVAVVGTTRTTPNDEELFAIDVSVVDFCCCCCSLSEEALEATAAAAAESVVLVVVVVVVILVGVVVDFEAPGGGGGGVATANDNDDRGGKVGAMTLIRSNVGVLLDSLGVVAVVVVVVVDSNKTHSLDGSITD
jgi:hypothetical protein